MASLQEKKNGKQEQNKQNKEMRNIIMKMTDYELKGYAVLCQNVMNYLEVQIDEDAAYLMRETLKEYYWGLIDKKMPYLCGKSTRVRIPKEVGAVLLVGINKISGILGAYEQTIALEIIKVINDSVRYEQCHRGAWEAQALNMGGVQIEQ
jgi:hypothetical protein